MSVTGDRILLTIKHLGLTQGQFAERLGFSRKRIQEYIAGAQISARFLQAVEEAFPDVNINYIRGKNDNIIKGSWDEIHGTNPPYKLEEPGNTKEKLEMMDTRIKDLEARILDKDELILSLREQVQLLKEKLGDCEDISKLA